MAPDGAPPRGFDYEIWQGPCPERAYNPTIVGGAWRWLFDYGTGDLGNDGVHRIDYCRYVMGLEGMPDAVGASGGKLFFTDGRSVQSACAQMAGMTQDAYARMMLGGGRSPDGNRYKREQNDG